MASSGRNRMPSLGGAAWLQKPETKAVFAALNKAGYVARAVGGAVRNALLDVPVHDVDLATTSPPDVTIQLAERAGLKAIPTGIDHGTVTIVADHVPFEVTTLRRDMETDGRHARIAFTDDWIADASRRDFTLNALYCDEDGTLHDPLGLGLDDLNARRVRFIGQAEERIREDYLRILRFFRFSAEYAHGELDADGLAACHRLRDGISKLSRERVRAELLRLLLAPHATDVLGQIADFLPLVLPFSHDISLFARLADLERSLGRTPDAILRLGALTGARPGQATQIQEALRLSSRELEQLARLSMPDPALESTASKKEAKAFIYRHGTDAYVDGTLISWARSEVPATDAAYLSRIHLSEHWKAPNLPIRGSDVTDLGVPPGPRIGQIMAAFEDWWIANDFPDDPAQLAGQLGQLVKSAS